MSVSNRNTNTHMYVRAHEYPVPVQATGRIYRTTNHNVTVVIINSSQNNFIEDMYSHTTMAQNTRLLNRMNRMNRLNKMNRLRLPRQQCLKSNIMTDIRKN
jgi:hypothetical protein